MFEAIDRWENEGGAIRCQHRPESQPESGAWTTAATTVDRRMASRSSAVSSHLAIASHGRQPYPSAAPELDGLSTRSRGVGGWMEIG
jgi:hypothetical protein